MKHWIIKNFSTSRAAVFFATDLFLTLLWTLGLQIHFNGSVWGSPQENYIKPLSTATLAHFLLALFLNSLVLLALFWIGRNATQRETAPKGTDSQRQAASKVAGFPNMDQSSGQTTTEDSASNHPKETTIKKAAESGKRKKQKTSWEPTTYRPYVDFSKQEKKKMMGTEKKETEKKTLIGAKKKETEKKKSMGVKKKKRIALSGKLSTFMERKRLFYLVSFLLILIAWLPYVLAYFPGGVYVDTFSSIISAYSMDDHGLQFVNNHHPILYTMLWRGAILLGRALGQGLFFSAGFFLTIQTLAMASLLAYLVTWVRKKGLGVWMTLAVQALLMFFPLFPLYAISLWKDTPFSLALLLFTMCVADYILERNSIRLKNTKYLFYFSLLGILVSFTRNNGKYVVFLTMLLLVLLRLRRWKEYKKMFLSFFLLLSVISVVQGPVYDKLNFNVDTPTESLGIPLQQMCYLVYYDYDLSEEELDYIESIVSIESIKELYKPCIFDSVKWYAPDFKGNDIQQDPAQFLKCYTNLMLEHPIGGIKAYLLATAGFWAPNIAGNDGYAQTWMWANEYGLEGTDLLEQWTGHTIRGWISNQKPLSSGFFLLLLIYTAFLLWAGGNFRKTLILLPATANWLTVMAATPIACSMRYVYILVLLVPIEILLVCTLKRSTTP